jgi:peptidoglycan/LPS O-acetylase OafA/YrhL
VPPLRALVDAGFDIALVVSRADRRRGRGGALSPSPVKAAALELGLPVTESVDDALTVGADLGVVVAFGRIIKPHVLAALPTFGALPHLALPAFFRETTFGPILLGVTLAHVLDHPRGFAWVSRTLGWRFAPVAALALVIAAANHPAPDISGWPRVAIHWAILALVAACVVREPHALSPALSLWPLRRIGAVSYGIYLYHLIVMHFVVKALRAVGATGDTWTFAANALASWGVAELSYRQYEARFLALKSRFSGTRPAPAAAGGARDAA